MTITLPPVSIINQPPIGDYRISGGGRSKKESKYTPHIGEKQKGRYSNYSNYPETSNEHGNTGQVSTLPKVTRQRARYAERMEEKKRQSNNLIYGGNSGMGRTKG